MKQSNSKAIKNGAVIQSDWMRQALMMLFNFMVVSVPLFFLFTTDELFEFNKMILTYYCTAAIAGLWLARMVWHRTVILKPTPLDVPLLLFLASQLIATFFSIEPYTSLLGYYSRFHGGLVSTFCYVILYYSFVSNATRRDVPALLFSTFSSAALVSGYAILEHFGHSISCLIVSGGSSFDASCWKQDVQSRVFATFGQPNWLAAYLITLLPVGIVQLVTTQINWKRWFYAGVSVLLFAALIFTKSRSGILGAAVGLASLAGFFLWFGVQTGQLRSWITAQKRGFSILTAVAVLCLGILCIFPSPYQPKLPVLSPSAPTVQAPVQPEPVANRLETGGSDSADIRKVVWSGAIKVWQRYPLFGSGVETFAYSYYLDRPVEHNLLSEWDFLYNKAHNEFLNLLATTGLFGLLSYCFLLVAWGVTILSAAHRAQNAPFAQLALPLGLLAGGISLSVSNFFGFSTVMVSILLFLYWAITYTQTGDSESQQPNQQFVPVQYFGFTAVSIATCATLVLISNYWQADMQYSAGKGLLAAGQFKPGVLKILLAIEKSPNEPLYYEELSQAYGQYAVQLAQAQAATDSAKAVETALTASDMALSLNSEQLNFYKSRARLLINLSALDSKYLTAATEVLSEATKKAPSDPKLTYNIGLIALSQQQNHDLGLQYLEKTIALKPNYILPREQLAEQYEKDGELEKSLEQLQYIITNIDPTNAQASAKIASLSAELKL